MQYTLLYNNPSYSDSYFDWFLPMIYKRTDARLMSSLQSFVLCHFKMAAQGGVLPIMAYTGGLRLKGVPFSGFRYIKG